MDIDKRIDFFLNNSIDEVEGEVNEYLSDLMEKVFDFIDSIEYDNLDESQQDTLDEILDLYDENAGETEIIDEVTKKIKKVIRGGKRVRKISCGPGFKAVGNKCVKMSSSEKRIRSKAGKKAARKSKSKSAQTARKRAKSMRKRT